MDGEYTGENEGQGYEGGKYGGVNGGEYEGRHGTNGYG